MSPPRPLYEPSGDPLRIAVFVSGGGGNLGAALRLAEQRPDLVSVSAVVSDRLGIPALDIADRAGVPALARDFEAECGRWAALRGDSLAERAYRKRAAGFHDRVLRDLGALAPQLDLIVLSYHRWIEGDLLSAYQDRMINQHAGDLGVLDGRGQRRYIGINPVYDALRAGERRTRTSTFVVTAGHDAGEILCQGPWAEYEPYGVVTRESALAHEQAQKERSDWPSLTFALTAIAEGRYGLGDEVVHADGTRQVYLDGRALPRTGVSLEPAVTR